MEERRFLEYVAGIAIVIILSIVVFLVVRAPNCGDAKCSPGEDCCLDCGCSQGLQCDAIQMLCIGIPVCGDGRCDKDETCCDDCGCRPGMRCSNLHVCVKQPAALCGNNNCDPGEDSCCLDCGCQAGFACNLKSMQCEKRGKSAVCGDGLCDFGEDVTICCDDCQFCGKAAICDNRTHRCVALPIDMSFEEAVRLLKIELLRLGMDSDSVNKYSYSVSPDVFEEKPAYRVCNDAKGFAELVCGYVTADGKVAVRRFM
ncbi:MAG: hypothetical protein ABIF10_01875 [Candidatus Woesearchaeota archaeon]